MGCGPFPRFDVLSNKSFSAQSGISVSFRLTCWPMLKRPNVGSWDLEGSAFRCQSAGLMRPSVRMAAAAETVVPCTKPQVYLVRPPYAGLGLKRSMSGTGIMSAHFRVSLKEITLISLNTMVFNRSDPPKMWIRFWIALVQVLTDFALQAGSLRLCKLVGSVDPVRMFECP